MCVSRSHLKDYHADTNSLPVQICDKKKQSIELLKVRVENDTDNYLWVRSQAKAAKENSMHNQFAQRFEEGLRGIQNSISRKGGTKKLDKVWERIGRIKEKYSSVHQYYEIRVSDNGKGIATHLAFEKKGEISQEDLRPIFHKTNDASMAHLHLGLLAFWLVSTIRYQLKLQGIQHDWSEIVRIMNTQKSVTTTMENKKGDTIQIRQCSEPNKYATS